MISTKAGTTLSRLNERGIVGGRLGQGAPQNAPNDWRVLEVLLAATSLETGAQLYVARWVLTLPQQVARKI